MTTDETQPLLLRLLKHPQTLPDELLDELGARCTDKTRRGTWLARTDVTAAHTGRLLGPLTVETLLNERSLVRAHVHRLSGTALEDFFAALARLCVASGNTRNVTSTADALANELSVAQRDALLGTHNLVALAALTVALTSTRDILRAVQAIHRQLPSAALTPQDRRIVVNAAAECMEFLHEEDRTRGTEAFCSTTTPETLAELLDVATDTSLNAAEVHHLVTVWVMPALTTGNHPAEVPLDHWLRAFLTTHERVLGTEDLEAIAAHPHTAPSNASEARRILQTRDDEAALIGADDERGLAALLAGVNGTAWSTVLDLLSEMEETTTVNDAISAVCGVTA